MNGQLKQSQTIEGIPKQNNGDLWINKFGHLFNAPLFLIWTQM